MEEMRSVMIDPKIKDAGLAMLVDPTIRTWGDAGSFAAANRGKIEPVVLEAVMGILQAQHNQMKDAAKHGMALEYAPILEGIGQVRRTQSYLPSLSMSACPDH